MRKNRLSMERRRLDQILRHVAPSRKTHANSGNKIDLETAEQNIETIEEH